MHPEIRKDDKHMAEKKKMNKYRAKTQKAAYLFIMPSMIILTVFVFVPLIGSLVLSVMNINIFMNDISFAGLKNYIKLVNDDRVWNATRNSLIFTITEVPIQIGLALLLTMVVAKENKLNAALRSVYYLPFVCSMTAISIVWSMLLDPNQGMVTFMLRKIGIVNASFLKDPHAALATIVGITVWKCFGYTLTLMTAAVLNISASLYEAAEMDGAGVWQRFIHITIPGIWPTISFCIVTTTIASLQMFDQSYIMTQGGPLYKTETVVEYIYDRGFQTAPYDIGYASAISVYLLLIIAIITAVLRGRVLKRDGDEID